MRFNKLDLNLLVALDAMLTEKNVSRAAERMFISQSAMSNALARLRQYFDDELLVQVGRRMELTPRAQFLQNVVRDVLVRVDAAVQAVPVFDYAHSDRNFTLFVSDYTLQTLVPHVLALAYQRAPGVRFQFLPQTSEPKRALERGEVDLMVIPAGYCSPDHPTEHLFDEVLSCVVWSGSRFAASPITLEDYKSASHVAVVPGLDKPAVDGLFLQQYGIARKIEVTTFSFASAAFLVLGTDRIATVHTRLAGQASKLLPLTAHRLPLDIPDMQQVVQWHEHRSFDPGLVWLRGLLHEGARLMDRGLSPVSLAAA
jgi:DNA-binding transcriptional LysR family regulator